MKLVEMGRKAIKVMDGGVVRRGGDGGVGGVPVRRHGEDGRGLAGQIMTPLAKEVTRRAIVKG